MERSGKIFALTHNYTGYPLIRRAREMAHGGELGELRLVQVEYPQDWLTEPEEKTGNKQAEWRVDPKRSGAGGALGDIGAHAYCLADFVTGLELVELAADLSSFGEGRQLDDNVQMLPRYKNGARGSLCVSQVAPGHENGLMLRVYGTKGSIRWVQANPNELFHTPFGESTRIITRGGPGSGEAAARVTPRPAGAPRRLSRRLRQHLRRSRRGDPSRENRRADPSGGAVPDDRGWCERARVRRGGGGVVQGEWGVGEGVGRRRWRAELYIRANFDLRQ